MTYPTTAAATLASILALSGCLVEGEPTNEGALAAGGDGHGGDCTPSPVMLSGDFDGDGVVTTADVAAVEARKDTGDYAAFFDMNADGQLTGLDVEIVARNLNRASHARDQQIARAFRDAERFRDIRVALANGFGPFTQELRGHGAHWANMARINRWQTNPGFDPGMPEGLNYGGDGHLAAVFYYAPGAYDVSLADPSITPRTVVMEIPPTEGFVGHHDHWHHHVGACFNGLGTPNPDFDQCVVGVECEAEIWSAKFHMLHLWMFDYNPCGAFAGTNPHLSPDADPEPHHMACMIQDVVDVVLPYGSL